MKNNTVVQEQQSYSGLATYQDIKKILKRAGPHNVTYRLAGQLAATELGMETGYLSQDMYIFAPSLIRFGNSEEAPLMGYISPSGLIPLGVLVDCIIAELRLHPFTEENDAWWSYQNALQRVLSRLNNHAILNMKW